MIKYFDEKNIIFSKLLFPYKQKEKKNKAFDKDSVIIGLGGNVGNVIYTFKKVFYFLSHHKKIQIVNSSILLQNPPFGFVEQRDFINTIIILNTSMRVKEFLKYILNIEKKLGRKRLFPNSPRTIDIDIIYFKNKIIKTDNLTIPHKDWTNRLSVIIPFNFI
jgi:2-amino-4-hydroxy-6-hydroxymethyldihydropteridine diphosphokinase